MCRHEAILFGIKIGFLRHDYVSSIAVSDANSVSTVAMGKTLQMVATETPANATDTTVRWSVSNATTATISTTGILTGVKAGTVKVTASSNDAHGVSGSETIVVAATLSLSANTAGVNALAGSTASVDVTSNSTWTASSNQSWLSVSPSSSTGNGTITFTAAANPTTATRTATVTVTATGATSQTITVTQAAGAPTLSVSAVTATIPSQATSTVVTITSNTTWTASSDQSWLTVSPSTKTGSGYLTFSTTALPTVPSRSATVTVSAAGVTAQTITVNQAEASLEVSSVTATVPTSATSTSVYIYSNTNWTASSNESWLSVSPSSKTGNGAITLATNAIPSADNRTATITVSSPGLVSQTITVTAITLSVSSNNVGIDAASGSAGSVDVTSNTTWTASSNQSWMFVNPTSATTGNGSITFMAIANNGSARSATITITGTGVPTQYVTVVQSAKNANNCSTLNITPSSVINEICNGGSNGGVSVAASGGTAPYKYKWNNTHSDSVIANVPAGNYSVVVTDALGCVATNSFTLTEPKLITITQNITTPTCGKNDGSVTLSVSGGTSPYSYIWNTGSTSNAASNLNAGLYSVTIVDVAACFQTENIKVSNAGAPVATVNSVVATQCNKNTGSIAISVSGGSAPYSFKWNDGATSQNRTAIAPGNYSLSITDNNSCIATVDTIVPATTFSIPSISLVTVDSATNKNVVVWMRDNTDAIKYYSVYRESLKAGSYTKLDTVLYSHTSVFIDKDANPFVQSYRYKLSATDYCGNEVTSDAVFKTMFLQQGPGLQANSVNLLWDSYEGTDFYTYTIYKLTTTNLLDSITSVSSDVNRYTDNGYNSYVKGYYVAIDLPNAIDPTQLKSDVGPFSQSMSNLSESQLTGAAKVVNNIIALYPNPAHGSFSITSKETAQVIVYTLNGTVVLSTKVDGKGSIATNGLPVGLYVVKVVTAQQVVTRSLVVE